VIFTTVSSSRPWGYIWLSSRRHSGISGADDPLTYWIPLSGRLHSDAGQTIRLKAGEPLVSDLPAGESTI